MGHVGSARDTTRGTEYPTFRSNHHPGQRLRKPLVEYCTNDWRNSPTYQPSVDTGVPDDEFLDRVVVRAIAVIRAPKFRRLLLLIVFLTIASVVLWIKFLGPFIEEERAAWSSLNLNSESGAGGVFGTNVRPPFPGMIHIQSLDPDLLPQSSKKPGGRTFHKKRLIFIGDIHGCREELESLLKKVQFDPRTDHLIAVGDVVSKGPDSLGVIDLLRGHQASCVRGNHEDRLLLIAEDLQSTSLRSNKNSKLGAATGKQAIPHNDDSERDLAMSLNTDQLAYLKSCPVILRVGELKGFHGEVVVAHAGLVPGLALENQDPSSVMNMRIIDLGTHVPSKKHERKGSVPWYKLWNRQQPLIPAHQSLARLRKGEKKFPDGQRTVIYGHDSKKGLQIQKYTKGLDTGCVKGGKLTALVADYGGKQEIVQVQCRDHRPRPPVQVDVDEILRNGKLGPPVDKETD
ncbi:uncharacterized protein Z518_00338 [Rhinocladiella mackenziei CBS 650.93]|uniref:Rhinocladiella mackenziei CBS 650.93 unplaced genomic scaffold supercont1.1, whole genome shotgun sequence n=1 Tax=Rhinocladiella mackenziei CBS 650.93 TaxID=1442369 RepID=A0A0D2IT83_9EURO|nr:uncharacterized protein Z518_00338 [Rhinocladiella mackenziei CBS 650.93]KIX09259.1 hypothetical protein Z518_00338 [Rhinocladiella mackenziei CBS 650.93]